MADLALVPRHTLSEHTAREVAAVLLNYREAIGLSAAQVNGLTLLPVIEREAGEGALAAAIAAEEGVEP
jgi:hypothetical protein